MVFSLLSGDKDYSPKRKLSASPVLAGSRNKQATKICGSRPGELDRHDLKKSKNGRNNGILGE